MPSKRDRPLPHGANPPTTVPARAAGLARRLVEDESGTSHFEYAIIAVFTGTALIAGLIVLQGGLNNAYRSLSALLDAVAGS
jgi:Flp pilus assembly pilin Flp